MRRSPFYMLVFVALAVPRPAPAQEPHAHSDYGVMALAKILCSGVFVSGRDLDDVLEHSWDFVDDEDYSVLVASRKKKRARAIVVDRKHKSVTVRLHDYAGKAVFYGSQGCVIHPPGFDRVFFQPTAVHSKLPDAKKTPWPMGDVLPNEPPPDVDPAKVTAAIDAAFDGKSLTAAVVVVHKGRIIGERYGQGADLHTQLESWSMGKSLTATLVGLLIAEGRFTLTDAAPVPAWHEDPKDPRGRITVADLMHMSSGLRFSHSSQPQYEWGRNSPDHSYVYTGAIDVFHFSITRPSEVPPNTVGRYRNCDPLTLGYIVREAVEKSGRNYHTWPQRALFDRIGIREQILETDPYGNFVLTGYDYGTARNWARLGLLYAQDGVWQGKRLLPEGFVEFVRTPAPAWKDGRYGGLFWINATGRFAAPHDAYYMAGYGGQWTLIIPSHDLVIVRMGHTRGDDIARASFNAMLKKLLDVVPPSAAATTQ